MFGKFQELGCLHEVPTMFIFYLKEVVIARMFYKFQKVVLSFCRLVITLSMERAICIFVSNWAQCEMISLSHPSGCDRCQQRAR
jgi:hypothetical protein